MDSSDLPCSTSTSILSNRKRKAEVSKMNQSKRAEFFATYQPQDFSLPNSVVFYMVKNPKSPELYEKMIQTCKYFFVKNPILVIFVFNYFVDDKWQLFPISRRTDLTKITSKLWIKYELNVHPKKIFNRHVVVNRNILSSVMPKIYQCDSEILYISNQNISFQDLSLLISAAEYIAFYDVTVKDKNGSNVDVEKIVEISVKAKRIQFDSDTVLSNVTSETMKELLKIPHFFKLHSFNLTRTPETFDLETFYGYMKKNKTTKIWLNFHASISEVYKNRLEEIVDEILETENPGYKTPCIYFAALEREKFNKLEHIYYSTLFV